VKDSDFDTVGIVAFTLMLTFLLRFFVGFAAQQWLGTKALITRTKGQTELPKN
jgi:hypothetical protein